MNLSSPFTHLVVGTHPGLGSENRKGLYFQGVTSKRSGGLGSMMFLAPASGMGLLTWGKGQCSEIERTTVGSQRELAWSFLAEPDTKQLESPLHGTRRATVAQSGSVLAEASLS